jgi:hypothetical protein
MQVSYSSNDFIPSNPQLASQDQDIHESNFLSRSIKWFREEDLNDVHKPIRKILAIATAILLSLTLVGAFWVFEGAMDWRRQDQLFQKKLENTEQLSHDAKPATLTDAGKETKEETKGPSPLQKYESILGEAGLEKCPISKKRELKNQKAEKKAELEKIKTE